MDEFIADMRKTAELNDSIGYHAFAAGIRHVLNEMQVRRPGSLPALDAANLSKLPPGFWDDEYFVLTPDAPVVVG